MAEHTINPFGESGEQPTRIPLSNDWNDSSRQHASSARQMNLVYNNLLTMHNNIVNVMSALANSAFKTSRPTISELDWVGDATAYSIGYSLTHCHRSASSPTSVAEGESFTAEILPDAGYTLNGVQASGSGFTQSYDSVNDKIVISASNVQNGMTIGCTATTFQVSVNYSLTGFNAESNTTMQSGGSFVKVLSPNTDYKVKTIVITMGGVTLDNSQVWDAATNTITIPLVTGNITITATAEESTAHTITYNLTGATKSSGPIEVEDGESLTAVIAKGADYPSASDADSGYVVGMLARDIVVLMGGQPLERGVDFTVSQNSADADITISIASVTGNVEIANILWKTTYICYRLNTFAGTTTAAGDTRGSAASAHSSNYIKLPSSCNSLAIYGRNVNGSGTSYQFGPKGETNDYAWGCALYDDNQAFVSGAWLGNDELGEQVPVAAGAVYLRTSVWMSLQNTNPIHINTCFIYDITNDKFIWCGDSVNKSTIRANYQNS